MVDPAVRIRGLTKRFGTTVAVDDVDFDVAKGSIFGFLGPNGSGKTTTLGMLTGLIPPDSGTASILGHDIRTASSAALASAGALIEEPAFYRHLSGRQNLRILAALKGASAESADELLASNGLGDRGDLKYKGYSLGMKRRLGLAAALLGDPPVVILDEPTNGLDPAGQHEVRAMLREVARTGRTVITSSHLLLEVQAVCSHVGIIHRGRMRAVGTLDDVLSSEPEIHVSVSDPANAVRILEGLDGVTVVTILPGDPGRVRVKVKGDRAAAVNRALIEAGIDVTELTASRAALEERFLEMTGTEVTA